MAVLDSIKQHITDAYNKVEAKTGTTFSPKNLQKLAGAIESIPTLDTSDATAAANQILSGQIAYVKGEKITGTIPTYDGASENLTA